MFVDEMEKLQDGDKVRHEEWPPEIIGTVTNVRHNRVSVFVKEKPPVDHPKNWKQYHASFNANQAGYWVKV